MNSSRTWPALIATLVAVTLAVIASGCGADDDGSEPSASGNAVDAAFIADMTAHHQGAIEMARIAQKRAEHPEIRALADAIVDAQEREIATMRTIRRDMPTIGEHGDGHMGMSEQDMGMDINPAMLEDARPFDRAFIDMMVPHHEGAIMMARHLLNEGEQPGLRALANDIIRAQGEEIAQMRTWRTAWYGPDGAEHDMHMND